MVSPVTIRDITYIGDGLVRAPNDGPALRYDPLLDEDVTDIAVHQWTGWLPPETWTAGEEIAYINRIDQYHRTTRGLDGIGYQVCVFPSGRVYITARLDKFGAHVGGENDHLIGIGLPGTFNLNLPSPKHLEACREAVRFIYEFLDKEVPTTPHLIWGGTTCPGDRWREWVPQLQASAQEEDMALAQSDLDNIATVVRKENNAANDRLVKRLVDGREGLHEGLTTGGGGLSAAQTRKALKDALKEGTG